MSAEPDPAAYLARIGVDPAAVAGSDLDALERLQRAHVTTVPFETLAVTGDPFGVRGGAGVSLAIPDLYDKIVSRHRGGFCYELNGLFGWLLAACGFDTTPVACRMVGDGGLRLPANHRANVVSLDRRYVVDAGMAVPTMRRPVPLDGAVRTDGAGVAWRVVESDRPDADYRSQYRTAGDDEWSDWYVFRDVARETGYFAATCDYLTTASESPFTGDPVVTRATDEGHEKLSPDALIRIVDGEERERPVDESGWFDALRERFGVRYP